MASLLHHDQHLFLFLLLLLLLFNHFISSFSSRLATGDLFHGASRRIVLPTQEKHLRDDDLPDPPTPAGDQKKKPTTTIPTTTKNTTQVKTKPKKPTNSSSTTVTSKSPPPIFAGLTIKKPVILESKKAAPSNSTTKILKAPPLSGELKTSKLKKTENPSRMSSGSGQIIKKTKKADILVSPQDVGKFVKVDKKKEAKPAKNQTDQELKKPFVFDDDDLEDLIHDFKQLPHKIIPDLERLSSTSKAYLTRANQEIVKGLKPIIGNHYAPLIASLTSYFFLLLPFLLITLLFNYIKEYLSLHKLIIFVHGYLASYFFILAVLRLLIGAEPLRFFYESSMTSYVYMQVMQTLFYVMYMLMLVLYLVVQFSANPATSTKGEAAGQILIAVAVGLHYYSAVFHNALMHKPPRTNWLAHSVYGFCFLGLCLVGWRLEKRKKGGDKQH